MNHLGIDVETKGCKPLINRLAALKSTHQISGPYPYSADRTYSQIHIDTTMTETELDGWLYRVKHGSEYVGTFPRTEPAKKKKTWKLYWSPEGRTIATVKAFTAREAKAQTPAPYNEFLGEVYAEEVT